MNKKPVLIVGLIILTLSLVLSTIFLINSQRKLQSNVSAATNCPGGTQILFRGGMSLRVGSNTALEGRIESVEGQAFMENKDGVSMATYVKSMKVKFPGRILLHSALIFDNDPKSGEQPWSINGVSLPVTGGGNWAPLFNLNMNTDTMNFSNGGDSSHFNVCVKDSENPPTHTPSPTKTPTPAITITSTPTPTITITPSVCPKPNTVTDIKIECVGCKQ